MDGVALFKGLTGGSFGSSPIDKVRLDDSILDMILNRDTDSLSNLVSDDGPMEIFKNIHNIFYLTAKQRRHKELIPEVYAKFAQHMTNKATQALGIAPMEYTHWACTEHALAVAMVADIVGLQDFGVVIVHPRALKTDEYVIGHITAYLRNTRENVYRLGLHLSDVNDFGLIHFDSWEENKKPHVVCLGLDACYGVFYGNLATHLLLADRFEDSEKAYRASISKNPLHAKSYNGLSKLIGEKALRLQGQDQTTAESIFAEAEELSRKALEIDPSNPSFYKHRGRLNMVQEKYDTAITAFGMANTLDPTDTAYIKYIGDCYKLKGETERAALFAQAAKRLESQSS